MEILKKNNQYRITTPQGQRGCQWDHQVTVILELEIAKANVLPSIQVYKDTRTRHKHRSHSDPSAINHLLWQKNKVQLMFLKTSKKSSLQSNSFRIVYPLSWFIDAKVPLLKYIGNSVKTDLGQYLLRQILDRKIL